MDEESAAAAAEKVTPPIFYVACIFVTALFRPMQSV